MKTLLKLLMISTFLIPNIHFYSCSSIKDDSIDEESIFEQYLQIRFQADQSLNQFLENIIEHYKLPGIAAAVVSKDSILKLGAFGLRRSDSKIRIDENDIFCIGSCCKSMTAVLAATLIEEGILS